MHFGRHGRSDRTLAGCRAGRTPFRFKSSFRQWSALMVRRLDTKKKDFTAQFAELLDAKRDAEDDVSRAARSIIAEVCARGDEALIELTERYDNARLTPETLQVRTAEVTALERDAPRDVVDALKTAAARIEAYHKRQLPKDEKFTDETGATLGWRWRPLESVGLYVPGGTAS